MYLGIFFAGQLGLAFLPSTELASFRADGVLYKDTGTGFFTSLYDRLLDAEHQMAGIQIWCLPEEAGLGVALAALETSPRPYLVRYAGSPAVYAVLFRALARGHEERLDGGGEQAFGGQIFRGEDGGLATSLDLSYLLDGQPSAETDLAAVRAATAHWTTITEQVEVNVAEA